MTPFRYSDDINTNNTLIITMEDSSFHDRSDFSKYRLVDEETILLSDVGNKEENGRENDIYQKKKILFGIVVFLSLNLVWITMSTHNPQFIHTLGSTISIWSREKEIVYGDDSKHNGPTLLAIYDGVRSELVQASNNPVYTAFQTCRFVTDQYMEHDLSNNIALLLDKERISSYHEPLQLSWSKNEMMKVDKVYTVNEVEGVNENDILALYCQSSVHDNGYDHDSFDFGKPRDAATITQARTTSKFHNRHEEINDDTADTWYIHSFPVIREEKCHFRLWRLNESTYGLSEKAELILLAVSNDVFLPPLETPTAIHLSLTKDPTEMVVQFTTGSSGTPIVEIAHPDKSVSIHHGTTTTYSNNNMCQYPANSTETGCFIPPGNLHTIIVDNLVPDTKYTYQIGLNEVMPNQIPYSFVTAPIIGTTEPYAFIVYGDQGCPIDGWAMGGNMSATMVEHELDHADIPIRAVHHFGDLSYARGNAHIWDAWFDMISVFSTRVPLLVGVGNHEYDHTGGGLGKDPSGEPSGDGFRPIWGNFGNDSGGECGVPISKRFYVPENGNSVFWYSYDIGLVHTIMLSSEHPLDKSSRQYKWLENDLQNVDRDLTPWIIVESHRPMYMNEFDPRQNLVGIAMRREFEDMLIKYNVDLFLSGHFHSYLRTCNGLYKSKCNNGGLTHITVGTAGAGLDDGYLFPSGWTDRFLKEWGYGKITVYNNTNLYWNFISSHGQTQGKILDEVWITK